MSFDIPGILESKRAYRQRLAALPIGEKLRLLDAMREREVAIRGRTDSPASDSAGVREDSATFRILPQ
jgi:hypothetical protein